MEKYIIKTFFIFSLIVPIFSVHACAMIHNSQLEKERNRVWPIGYISLRSSHSLMDQIKEN